MPMLLSGEFTPGVTMASMRSARRWTSACSASLLLLASCTGSPPQPAPVTSIDETANASTPRWVVKQPTQAPVAVVFVHGLFGDTLKTWTHASGRTFFDLVATHPVASGKVDVFAFGFPSHMFASGSFTPRAAAEALHETLKSEGVLRYRKVVFVGHSMGGIVIMRELLTNRESMPPVPVVVFIATPQEGADIARIAQYVARNPALAELTPADHTEMFKVLNNDWRGWTGRPKVKCAYENRKTRGIVQVVEWSSSTRYCDEAVEVSADHLDIVKPSAATDLQVRAVTNALADYVFNPALDPKLETPGLGLEGDRSVFSLSTTNARLPSPVENTGGAALKYSLGDPSDANVLLLWPDRPQDLPAKGRDSLFVYLTSAATRPEYTFTLRTDYGLARTVVVRAPNLAVVRAQQTDLLRRTTDALAQEVGTRARTGGWTAAPSDSHEVQEGLVDLVRTVVAREHPGWPESHQFAIAADVLQSLNWPALAATALRRAERASPAIASTSAVRALAASVRAQSGEEQIFLGADTPPPASVVAPSSSWLTDVATAGRVAADLTAVPALKVYGLSLDADVRAARGDTQGARASLESAAAIRRTPSIDRRLVEGVGRGGTRGRLGAPGTSEIVPLQTPSRSRGAAVSQPK